MSTEPSFWQRRFGATRGEKITMWISFLLAIAILVSAYAGSKSAPAWLRGFDFGIVPIGIAECLLACTYLARAHANDPAERFSRRSNYQLAAIFFVLGALTIALVAYKHFKGA